MATFSAKARTPLDLATSVKDARLAAGMSQADLASAAHLTRSWVSLFESGHSQNASLTKVLAMLDVLGVSVRLTYAVPDSDSSAGVGKSARRPEPRASVSSAASARRVEASGRAVLNASALNAARARRNAHRARAAADDLTHRPADE